MYVEATAAVAERIVAGCIRATCEVLKEETKKALGNPLPAAPAVDPEGKIVPDGKKEPDQSLVAKSGVAKPVDKCIRYCAKRCSYEVIYQKDKDGKLVRSRSIDGLGVKYNGANQVKLKEKTDKAHEKAKRLWNKLDKSDRKRYE